MRFVLCSLLVACAVPLREPASSSEATGTAETPPVIQPSPPPIGAPKDSAPKDSAPKDAPPQPPPEKPPVVEDPPTTPARYSAAERHSPMTTTVAQSLTAIAARATDKQDNVFAKVGDSITVSTSNLACFSGTFDLASHSMLESTRAFFAEGDAAGSTPFARKSLAAKVGWSAIGVLSGALESELAAIKPRYAVVMFGTNDVEGHAPTTYGERMFTIVDKLIVSGVIPIMSSIPPRDDKVAADVEVPRFNAIARGIAEARQIPFMNLHDAMMPLAKHGLDPDGVHPNSYLVSAGYRACTLDQKGLGFGYNTRNLLTLEALDRARSGVALDPEQSPLSGDGTKATPIVIDALPFTHSSNTQTHGESRIAAYDGCNAAQDESGSEVLYRFTATQETKIRAMVIDHGSTDIDLHILDSSAQSDRCIARHDNTIAMTLAPGTYFFSLDTFAAKSGEYLFVLLED